MLFSWLVVQSLFWLAHICSVLLQIYPWSMGTKGICLPSIQLTSKAIHWSRAVLDVLRSEVTCACTTSAPTWDLLLQCMVSFVVLLGHPARRLVCPGSWSAVCSEQPWVGCYCTCLHRSVVSGCFLSPHARDVCSLVTCHWSSWLNVHTWTAHLILKWVLCSFLIIQYFGCWDDPLYCTSAYPI